MRSEYDVEPLGMPPHFAVSLYREPRVEATLGLQSGSITLNLQSVGWEVVNKSTRKGNYAGFMIV